MTEWEENAVKSCFNGMSKEEKIIVFLEMMKDESFLNIIKNDYCIEMVFNCNT